MNDEIIKQLQKNDDYKKITYSIFSYIEDDGFVTELECLLKTKTDINDYVWKKIEIKESDKNGIITKNRSILKKYNEIKFDVERNLQKERKLKIFIKKDKGIVFAVKYKDYDF